ncbi:DUF1573 domain-containing protein [Stieleria sp. TO1_6]|uniref:DUF1573 domain-containing protein n=1 Tax=Stieleria tagensis TaxID=2956795 RepID=UPI00209AC8E6|nr:DUF1573 domain-containing protein [Stieleria tagensis]MCO8121818.1 DUF1573 domain-containing protein [Stieleria tagensis]
MTAFSRKLIWCATGMLTFMLVTAAFAMTVTYKPYGVPDHLRDQYDMAVDNLKTRQVIRQNLDDRARPVARIDQQSHDFGMINPHSTASHTFEISNDGDDPLSLSIRETSCKCTIGDLKSDLLLPGETTEITLTWNTGYKEDRYEQTATIVTNDPLKKTIELKVSGQVRAKLVAPESLSFPKLELGERGEVSFVVYSQLWENFVISKVQSDLDEFEWTAVPADRSDSLLVDQDPLCAWTVRLSTLVTKHGEFNADVTLEIQPSDGSPAETRTIPCQGKTRPPISFASPEIHATDGLDFGTLTSGTTHQFHLAVRVHGDKGRHVEVLDHSPKELSVALAATKIEGTYRLTITVPADCPMVVFNRRDKQGYVQVGDPDHKEFSSWFPLHGAVVTLD